MAASHFGSDGVDQHYGSQNCCTHFLRYVRHYLGNRTFPYIDDFLIAPSPCGTVVTLWHCSRAVKALGRVLKRPGLTKHTTKGE